MWLIGRQPILDRDERIVAHELLLRSPGEDSARFLDPVAATSTVILGALSGFGLQQVLGGHQGFVNVDENLPFDDALELLPRESVVLELVESIRPTEAVVRRCQELRTRQWHFAGLDDQQYAPEYEPLYPLVDVVKIDLSISPPETIGPALQHPRRYPLRLLAEKVETPEQSRQCHDLGFHLFQGYYFPRLLTMTRPKIDEDAATLLRLQRLLTDDADIWQIEAAFQASPGLTYHLLTLVDSVGFGLGQPIRTVRQAIVMLGHQQMARWIQLALFGANGRTLDNPLLEAAAVRATFMNQLAPATRPWAGCATHQTRRSWSGSSRFWTPSTRSRCRIWWVTFSFPSMRSRRCCDEKGPSGSSCASSSRWKDSRSTRRWARSWHCSDPRAGA